MPTVKSAFEELDYPSWLAGTYESAQVVVPLVMDAVRPSSVVDVGCGLGAWLAVFREHGVEEVLGYDGPWVDRSQLQIAPGEYRGWDLRRPLIAERRFDLAVCLETAHLLAPEEGDRIVASLVDLSDVVLFSTAIPAQPGNTDANLQWPRYWAERFAGHGLVATDPFRLALWEHPDVKWWFPQNLLCFATEAVLARSPVLERARCAGGAPLPLVHPGCFQAYIDAEAETQSPRGRRWFRRGAST